jgi:hypothetical protein
MGTGAYHRSNTLRVLRSFRHFLHQQTIPCDGVKEGTMNPKEGVRQKCPTGRRKPISCPEYGFTALESGI